MTTRPTIHDAAIAEQLAKHFAPEVVQWIDEDDDQTSEVESDLATVFTHAVCLDAYKLVRDLERLKSYDGDESLVEIMSGVQGKAFQFVREAEKAWLPTSGLVAPVIGAKVAFRQSSFSTELTVGEVTSNHAEGKSTVFCEHLGHVREGVGSHGIIVNWEKMTPAPIERIYD